MNRTIGDYEVLAELGRGGMGVVYRVRHRTLRTDYALKVLLAAGGSPEVLARFEREARTVAQLEHPGIVRLRHYGQDGGLPFMVMDLIEGASLRALAARGPGLAPREAARIVARVARAVAHAHAHGVIHRDIKPANVFVGPGGEPILGDFGLAKDLASAQHLTRTGQTLGTPSYMAPEQLDGVHGAAGPPADVYGLGATLYALLCGRPPREGSALEIAVAVTKGEVDRLRARRPDVDPALAEICDDCLRRDPDRRPDAATLADRLERWLQGEPAAPPATPRRGARAAVALGLLAAVALGALVVVSRAAPPPPTAPRGPAWYEALAPELRPPLPLPDAIDFDGPGAYVAKADRSVELAWIPPGRIRFGGPDGPLVAVSGFFIARRELTWEQLERTALPPLKYDDELRRAGRPPRERAAHDPVTQILWFEAIELARRLGLHLPSEAQWQLAAGGPVGADGGAAHVYPWGDAAPDADRCVFGLERRQGPRPPGEPARAAGRTAQGCADMAGNVSEWTIDHFDDDAPPEPGAVDPLGPAVDPAAPDVPLVSHHGGGFFSGAEGVRATARTTETIARTNVHVGVRLAWSPLTAERMREIDREREGIAKLVTRIRTPWRRITPERSGLEGRQGHAAAYEPLERRILLFGGRRRREGGSIRLLPPILQQWSNRALTDAHAFDRDSNPTGRFDHAMTWDARRRRLVMFGGRGGRGEALGDLWEWNETSGWHLIDTSEAPGPRWGHAMTFDPDSGRVLLFGGATAGEGGPERELDDLWTWEGSAGVWTRVGPPDDAAPGTWPPARTGHGLAHDDAGASWLFGGRRGETLLDDSWALEESGWRRVEPGPGGNSPNARAWAPMAGGAGRVMLYGGASDLGEGRYQSAWLLHRERWTHLVPPIYPEVSFGALVIDPDRETAVLIGARDGKPLEAWEYPLGALR